MCSTGGAGAIWCGLLCGACFVGTLVEGDEACAEGAECWVVVECEWAFLLTWACWGCLIVVKQGVSGVGPAVVVESCV